MSKFYIKGCVDAAENGTEYNGQMMMLVNAANEDNAILFPINEEDSKIIVQISNPEAKINVFDEKIGIYRTMVESWEQSGRFLSGIFLDEFDGNVCAYLVISDSNGSVDCISSASFYQAAILSAFKGVYFHLSERLLEAFQNIHLDEETNEVIDNETESSVNKTLLPKDPEILNIAKKIMLGETLDKIKKVEKTIKPEKKKSKKTPKTPKSE